jgi:NAD(P)-dependent dehydrogenase (short-subunit alcohol dehydrogenase family)
VSSRRFLVTGGSQGIGAAVVEQARQAGHQVVFTGRDEGRVQEVAGKTGGYGLRADVGVADDNARTIQVCQERMGGVDVLVNNAGVGLFAPVAEMSVEDWHAVIETNVNGVFYCTREAIPRMKKRGGGYIFNVSSLAGRNAFPGAAAYCASKHAVNGFSEALFQEVRDDGIRVTYLMPGSVATAFGRGSTAKQGWALQPADVGEMVVDLLRTNPRAMHSRVEMRPSRPPKR